MYRMMSFCLTCVRPVDSLVMLQNVSFLLFFLDLLGLLILWEFFVVYWSNKLVMIVPVIRSQIEYCCRHMSGVIPGAGVLYFRTMAPERSG